MRKIMCACLGVLVVCLATASARAEVRPQIVWEDNIYQAFKLAMDKNVPLVVYFHHDCNDGTDCPCWKLMNGPLSSPEFIEYGHDAIYARVNVSRADKDANIKQLTEQLGIKDVPIVSILHCKADQINEIGRVVGYYVTPTFMTHFRGIYDKAIVTIRGAAPKAQFVSGQFAP